jgi:hypothetical protein
MLRARDRLKRVRSHSRGVIWAGTFSLIVSLGALPTSSPAATTFSHPIRGVVADTGKSFPARQIAIRPRPNPVVVELAAFTRAPTATDSFVVNLIHRDFPARAWHDAEAVAWCESKFRPTDIGFDSNGTHDRGVFQLNDGGTAQYLMAMIGQNPNNLNLAFNPVLNVRAAALLYARDGWSQWSCESAI